MPREFEDMRNYFLRKLDLFDNDVFRTILVHKVEFQILGGIMSQTRLVEWITKLLYGEAELNKMLKNDSLMETFALVLLCYHIALWIQVHI